MCEWSPMSQIVSLYVLYYSVEILDHLGVSEVREYEKYLGLPAVVGRNKKASLNFIKERVWSKLQGWKEKLLSQAGREALLKAVNELYPPLR